ncbi:MAG: ABC transporter permease, partial [Planctomycetota bacterium]|nr:ABC transporter permease [Planctomycetota bacterium]
TIKEFKGADVYRWLLVPANWSAFQGQLQRVKKPLPPAPDSKQTREEAFEAFLKDWQGMAAARAAVLAGDLPPLAEAQRTILKGRDPAEILAQADPGVLAAQLDKCGFHTNKAQMAIVARRADLSVDAERIDSVSRAAAFKTAFAEHFGLEASEVDQDVLFAKLAAPEGAAWFVAETDKTAGVVDPRLSDAGVREAAAAALPISEVDLAMTLAETTTSPDVAAEIALLGLLSPEQVRQLAAVARREKKYIDFFDVLPVEKRDLLLGPGGKMSHEWLLGLQKDGPKAFLTPLEAVDKDHKFPDEKPAEQFPQFLEQWKQTEGLREAVREGRGEIFSAVQKALRTRPDLAKVDTKTLTEAIAQAGVQRLITTETIEIVRRQIGLVRSSEQIAALIRTVAVREWLARQILPPKDALGQRTKTDAEWAKSLTEGNLLDYASTMDGARRLRGYLDKLAGMRPLNLTPDRVRVVAEYWAKERNLSDIEAGVVANVGENSQWGFSGRTVWLLVVSFLVCVVGIANAMLMSVTERFREIATMKCLGATDRFIMINFVLESCIQGVAGGIAGTALGLLLGTLRGFASYGWIALANYPVGEVLAAAGISLVAGVVISALAAVYPAWVAARLAPMEAMRIE